MYGDRELQIQVSRVRYILIGCTVDKNFRLHSAVHRAPDISQRSWVRYSVWPHTFVSPSADSRGAVVSYWRKYVNEVVVNRLGGLSLPRKSMVWLTVRPDLTLDVYRGRKTTTQQQQQIRTFANNKDLEIYIGTADKKRKQGLVSIFLYPSELRKRDSGIGINLGQFLGSQELRATTQKVDQCFHLEE